MVHFSMNRPLRTIVLALAVILIFSQPVLAAGLAPIDIGLDTSIVKSDDAYSIPTSIVILPLFPPTSDFDVTPREWFKGLYYYLVANDRRPGFTDIPFHYVVTTDGEVFKGNSGGEERKISISGIGDNSIVIAYLAGRQENAFSDKSEQKLASLVLEVANRNSISFDNISVATVNYKRDDASQTVKLEKADLFGRWNLSLNSVLDSVRGSYSPTGKTYHVEVSSVDITTDAVAPGNSLVGKITLKNTGEFGIYGDQGTSLMATKVGGGTSMFYLNNNWLSNTQFAIMQQTDNLLPGDEQQYSFTLNIPLNWGEQSEDFEIGNLNGQDLGVKFTVKMNISRPDGTIVQIKDTDTGFLRVRATDSGAAEEISRVSPGERYFQLNDDDQGWIQIRLNDGREGWVAKQYVSYL